MWPISDVTFNKPWFTNEPNQIPPSVEDWHKQVTPQLSTIYNFHHSFTPLTYNIVSLSLLMAFLLSLLQQVVFNIEKKKKCAIWKQIYFWGRGYLSIQYTLRILIWVGSVDRMQKLLRQGSNIPWRKRRREKQIQLKKNQIHKILWFSRSQEKILFRIYNRSLSDK